MGSSDTGCRPSAPRLNAASVLCGVTRVGLVAKGLLIKGDMDLELVLMCREKPTKLLLYTVSANLPLQIQVCSPAALGCIYDPSFSGKKRLCGDDDDNNNSGPLICLSGTGNRRIHYCIYMHTVCKMHQME